MEPDKPDLDWMLTMARGSQRQRATAWDGRLVLAGLVLLAAIVWLGLWS